MRPMRYRITIITQEKNRHFYFEGSRQALAALIDTIEGQGYQLNLSTQSQNFMDPLPLLIALESEDCDILESSALCPILVWDRLDSSGVREVSYAHGAFCVLPKSLTVAALMQALSNAALVASTTHPNHLFSHSVRRNYKRGEQIHLEEDRIIQILRGVVRCTSLHPDGSEVLIGFYTENDILIAHHAHTCYVEMAAHSALLVLMEPWSSAAARPEFYNRLKERICQMELWSSMQARGTMEGRLLGILQVIAGKFGMSTRGGTRLNIKLTHELLASAIGATRTTVTRILGGLKKEGKVAVEKTVNGEFLLLPDHGMHHH